MTYIYIYIHILIVMSHWLLMNEWILYIDLYDEILLIL